MKTVYKYTIAPDPTQHIDLPNGAEILKVEMQQNIPCIWVLVDVDFTHMERRWFRLVGTGQEFEHDERHQYIGTFLMYEGTLVWHLFEVR